MAKRLGAQRHGVALEDELHDHGVIEQAHLGNGVRNAVEALQEVEQGEGNLAVGDIARPCTGPSLLEIGRKDLEPGRKREPSSNPRIFRPSCPRRAARPATASAVTKSPPRSM